MALILAGVGFYFGLELHSFDLGFAVDLEVQCFGLFFEFDLVFDHEARIVVTVLVLVLDFVIFVLVLGAEVISRSRPVKSMLIIDSRRVIGLASVLLDTTIAGQWYVYIFIPQ